MLSATPPPWPAALQLVAACCVWPQDGTRIRMAARLDPEGTDVVAAARRHRVAGLVARGLALAGISLGPEADETLAADVTADTRRSLAQAGETVRLQRLLDSRGFDNLVFKGAVLAAASYGDVGIKRAKDIDLLIEEADVAAVIALLASEGYVPAHPRFGEPEWLKRYVKHYKDLPVIHRVSGIVVEVHWRLFYNPQLFPDVSLGDDFDVVPMGGVPVRTFPREVLYGYLCVHGSVHGWSRLKWAAELQSLLARGDSASPEDLHAVACRRGLDRVSAVFLLLAHRRLDLNLRPTFVRRLRKSPIVRLLLAIAERNLTAGGGSGEITDHSPGWWFTLLSRPLARRGPGYFFGDVKLIATPVGALMDTNLPAPLHGLLWLVRAPAWLVRKALPRQVARRR